MADLLSPGISIREFDDTTTVGSVSSSVGAIAGLFRWGPVNKRVLINDEDQLVRIYHKPTDHNAETWFTAANFLKYAGSLQVVRAANVVGNVTNVLVSSISNGSVANDTFVLSSGNTDAVVNGMFVYDSSVPTTVAVGNSSTAYAQVVNSTAIRIIGRATTVNTEVRVFLQEPNLVTSAVAVDGSRRWSYQLPLNTILNETDYEIKKGNIETGVAFIAKYPGAIGNSLKISLCDSAVAWTSKISLALTYSGNSITGQFITNKGSNAASIILTGDGTSGSNTAYAANVAQHIAIGDTLTIGNSVIGFQKMRVTSVAVNSAATTANTSRVNLRFDQRSKLRANWSTNTYIIRSWEFRDLLGTAPGTTAMMAAQGRAINDVPVPDEIHAVVVDEKGYFTGTPGTILEVFKGMSRATNAKKPDGTSNYFADVLNNTSKYVWVGRDRPYSASATMQTLAATGYSEPYVLSFKSGYDADSEATVDMSTVAYGYDPFMDRDSVDISILMQGKAIGGSYTDDTTGVTVQNFELAQYLMDNFVGASEVIVPDGGTTPRNDIVITVSPDKGAVINVGYEDVLDKLLLWRDLLGNSSYTIMDTGYKYQYDRYNDVHRWIPLNGDIAGIIARTDHTNDSWWSPAGFTRGQVKGVVRLAYEPNHTHRDALYSVGINPVVSFTGSGTILYGDKTLQYKSSAFDRINVRRLFIQLEKVISDAAKYSLFEFNDAFTRSQFKNMIVPYLRSIQGKRGIHDFYVICDETNNTGDVIDANKFIADIYIKPARSINFINLNFVAVGTSVSFSTSVRNF
jgi:phage tail sheath protein FI